LARRPEDVQLTHSGALLGTPRYMSPEQALAQHGLVDHRTDVYSLGATLYELLTRRPAFDGATLPEVVVQILERDPLPPRRLNPLVPRDLETIILKAMSRRPDDRYASAKGLADDLRRYRAGEPIQARRIGVIGRTLRWAQRDPGIAALLEGMLLVLVNGTVVSTYFAYQALQRAREASAAQVEAEQHAEESRQRAVRLYVEKGVRLMNAGDLFGSLPWLVEALALDESDPERAEVHRRRIGHALR